MSGKMLKQNAVKSKNAKLKCRKFSTLQKRKFKMQQSVSSSANTVFTSYTKVDDSIVDVVSTG